MDNTVLVPLRSFNNALKRVLVLRFTGYLLKPEARIFGLALYLMPAAPAIAKARLYLAAAGAPVWVILSHEVM